MTPEDWRQSMLSEADHAPDPQWAKETRRAAWLQARTQELRLACAWQPMLLYFLLFVMPPLQMLYLRMQGEVTGPLTIPFMLVFLLLTPGVLPLVTLLWVTRRVLDGQAVWTAGLIPSGFTLLGAIVSMTGELTHSGRITYTLTSISTFLWFIITPFVFAWAVGQLKHAGDQASPR